MKCQNMNFENVLISETGDSNRFKQVPLEITSSISKYYLNFDPDLKPKKLPSKIYKIEKQLLSNFKKYKTGAKLQSWQLFNPKFDGYSEFEIKKKNL